MADKGTDLAVRRSHPDDWTQIRSLLSSTLGWLPDDHHDAFFDWKHRQNPFGESPEWVMVDGDRVVGYRVLMRWAFDLDDRRVTAVRAVDTATDPAYQGRGIFSRLTLHAIDELAAEGVGFVFNTPNDKSRPGYLKMGWELVARLTPRFLPRGPASLVRLVRAKVPAEKWSLPTAAGVPASEVTPDPALGALGAAMRRPGQLATPRDVAFLTWRYGFEPFHYRAVLLGRAPADGAALFRLRRRGSAVEAAICDLLVPPDRPRAARTLVRRVLRASGADYAVGVDPGGRTRPFGLPLPGQGPTLTWRHVTEPGPPPPPDAWSLTLGDVELF